MVRRTVFIWAIFSVASSVAFASPSVSSVSYWQNPTSRLVKVTYTLSGEAGVPLLDIRTNGVSIGWSNLRGAYGDVHKVVSPGIGKTIWWNPNKAWPGHSLDSDVTAVVRVWPKNNPPDVMVVNCERQYEGRDDVVQYYASFEHLPEGTVNCDAYKTASKMAFRKIPAAGIVWRMGSPVSEKGRDNIETQHKVRLSSNYYLGVFEVTQSQYKRITGLSTVSFMFQTDGAMRPAENLSWQNVRGEESFWPGNARADAYNSVSASSFIGKLRKHAGGLGFDLPTEAQWEFACRAGSGGAFPDKTSLATGTESVWPYLESHARYKSNSGNDSTTSGNALSTNDATAVVGTYLPNRWGLYDMLGNVYEMTLDWCVAFSGSSEIVENPYGADTPADTNNKRTMRGGAYLYAPKDVRAAKRYGVKQSQAGRNIGFRLCLPL
jgi:formylglycine-generating enzyme required for sulfatase activity